MSARSLLVTGSRALDDTRDASVWARAIVRFVIDQGFCWLVVAGDARGPDDHAIACARSDGAPFERWCLDGFVRGSGERRWWPEGEPRRPAKLWPLERNRRMVEAFAERAKDADRVLALYAPWARTQGTAHTVGLPRAPGLRGMERV